MRRVPGAALAVAVALAIGSSASAQAAEFQVDKTDDLNPVFPGTTECTPAPNDCTLRGALLRADGTTQADLVSLPAGTFRRDPTQPSIDILHSVSIAGAGARSTVIEGAGTSGPGPTLRFTIQPMQATPNTSAVRDLTITKGTNIRGGGGAGSGAGIMADGTNLSLDRVTVAGNEAQGAMPPGSGGGIGFLGTGGRTLTIDNSAITGNRAVALASGARGAGIDVSAGSATIRSSTIAGNVADGNGTPALGGGLAAVSGASVSLDRVTVAGNLAEDVAANPGVGNLWRDGTATITATRSIVADGIAPAGSNTENCAVPITTQGMNVEDRNQCGFGAADRRATPVGLGVLANYGGPTNTRSITQASPAFDFAGDCLMADQRSLGPAFAACDSGAFELQAGDPADGSPPPGGGTDPPGTPLDELPAELTGYGLSRTTFAAAGRGGSIATKPAARARVKVGTTVRYTLSEPATLTFKVERVKGGRLVGGVCKKKTRKNRTKPKCDLPLKGSFTDAGETGANAFKFTGRLDGKALKPGKYQLVATALDAAGNSTLPQRTKFTIAER